MKNQFWSLRADERVTPADWTDKVDLESVKCAVDSGHQRAGRRLTPLTLELPFVPTKDIVWTWMSECLITDEVARLFARYKLTGYRLEPVYVGKVKRFKDPLAKPQKLWEFLPYGWSGVAPETSGIRVIESCTACGYLEYGGITSPSSVMDAQQWDGSDFFIVWPMPRFIFMSTRAKEIIERAELTGCRIQSPIEVLSNLKIEGFGPGRLSYYFPMELAKKWGTKYGIV